MQGVYFSDALWQEINQVSGVGHEVGPVAVEILLNRQQRNGVALRIERQYREVVRRVDGIGGCRMLTQVASDLHFCPLRAVRQRTGEFQSRASVIGCGAQDTEEQAGQPQRTRLPRQPRVRSCGTHGRDDDGGDRERQQVTDLLVRNRQHVGEEGGSPPAQTGLTPGAAAPTR